MNSPRCVRLSRFEIVQGTRLRQEEPSPANIRRIFPGAEPMLARFRTPLKGMVNSRTGSSWLATALSRERYFESEHNEPLAEVERTGARNGLFGSGRRGTFAVAAPVAPVILRPRCPTSPDCSKQPGATAR